MSSRRATCRVLVALPLGFLVGCGPDFQDGTILCDRDEQCYSGAECRQSPDRSRKYCYVQPPAEVDAAIRDDDRMAADVVKDAAPGSNAVLPPSPDAAPTVPENSDAANSCPMLSEGAQESLDDVVEDLGSLQLPDGWSMRTPGPSAWLADGKRIWLLPNAARADGLLSSSGSDAPRNYPTAAWILSGSQSPLKIDPPPKQEPPAFVSLLADEVAAAELWPSAIARNFSDLHQDTLGVALLRRVVGGTIDAVMLARIGSDSTVGTRLPTALFTGSDLRFSTGLFSGSDNTYVYACDEDDAVDALADERYRCVVARTSNANIEDRESYRVYRSDNGTELWSGDLSAGTPVLFGASDLSIRDSQYLNHKRVAVYVHPRTGRLVVQTAQRPWGPWTKRGEVDLPLGVDAERPSSAFVIMEDRCGQRIHVAYATPTRRDGRGYVTEARTRLAAVRWR